jgi:hypothetical protein
VFKDVNDLLAFHLEMFGGKGPTEWDKVNWIDLLKF